MVFPAPFGPKSPKISPSFISKFTPLTAVMSSNLFTRFLTIIAFPLSGL
ncbi:MAG: hypothetical protein KGD63_10210 [Candidatus Lokiarchaeota archaeon]|nr:hypothetical protein [Candidatus Lokiarchaeota archaeon]